MTSMVGPRIITGNGYRLKYDKIFILAR